jgi:hypothetical protein
LNPEFWRALGRALEWGLEWRARWHRLIDELAEGWTVEQAFEAIGAPPPS